MASALAHLAQSVLRGSLDASLLVLVISALKGLAGNRLSARWHAMVWLPLLLRLCLFAPILPGPKASPRLVASEPAPIRFAPTRPPAPPSPAPDAASARAHWHWRQLLVQLWALGALASAGFLGTGAVRFWLAIRRGRVITLEPVLALLEATKAELGIRTLVALVETDRVQSPALFGCIRPRLLVPVGFLASVEPGDLRPIFRHELCHLKRLDIFVAWLSCALQALHWFNPLIWYAFLQLRRDRELACDEAAVAALDPPAIAHYGHTLLRLFERIKGPEPLPNLAAIVETPSILARRIHMLAHLTHAPRRPRPLASWLSLAGLTLCALGGLSYGSAGPARTGSAPATPPAGFQTDAALIGGWRTVDFVPNPDRFMPGQRQWKDSFFLPEWFFRADGSTSFGATWTQGLCNPGRANQGRYQIRTLEGRTFLFLEWMNGDVTDRGAQPHWYALEKAPQLREVAVRRQDRIDFPFEADPACLGHWTSVAVVSRMEDFDPAKPGAATLAFNGLEFKPEGKTSAAWTWTRGLLLHKGDHTASRYEIRELGGTRYLFMEWKSGDYIFSGKAPLYYVLKAG